MKSHKIIFFILCAVLFFGGMAPAMAAIVDANVVAVNGTKVDASFTESATGTRVLWDIKTLWKDMITKIIGGYFIVGFAKGTGSQAITIKWYMSIYKTGETIPTGAKEWVEYIPSFPCAMPSSTATFPQPIPFIEGTQRVYAEITFLDTTLTDVVSLQMIPATR